MIKLSVFDILLLIVAVSIVIKVCIRGFVAEFFSFAAFVAAAGAAFRFFRPLAQQLPFPSIPPKMLSVIAFFIIFIAVFLLVKLIEQLVAAVFKNQILASLDHALGFFLGLFEACVVIIIILAVLQLQPLFDASTLLLNSMIVQELAPFLLNTDDAMYIIKDSGIL